MAPWPWNVHTSINFRSVSSKQINSLHSVAVNFKNRKWGKRSTVRVRRTFAGRTCTCRNRRAGSNSAKKQQSRAPSTVIWLLHAVRALPCAKLRNLCASAVSVSHCMRAWLSTAWHFRSVHGRLHVNNPFASSAVTCTMSQLRTSSERKLNLSATRQPAIYRRNRSSVCLLRLSNSLFFVSFLRLSDLSHTQEQAGSMPWMKAATPSPSHNRDGTEKVRTFDKRTHRHELSDLQRFVSVLWLRHAQLRDLVEVWALTGECSPPVRECSPPDRNRPIFFVQTFVDFALSLPVHSLWVCLRPGPWIFLRKDEYGQEVKISSKCPTSATASPHVKYVKGC